MRTVKERALVATTGATITVLIDRLAHFLTPDWFTWAVAHPEEAYRTLCEARDDVPELMWDAAYGFHRYAEDLKAAAERKAAEAAAPAVVPAPQPGPDLVTAPAPELVP